MTRAKFECTHKLNRGEDGYDVTLQAVTSGSEENDQFFNYTPYGQIQMTVITAEAAKQFYERGTYYVDFTLADKEG